MDIEDSSKVITARKTSFGEFVSPLKALAFNFRFNQFFGIFPGRISQDWTDFIIVKKLILLTFSIKAIFFTLILTLVYLWLHEQVRMFFFQFCQVCIQSWKIVGH